MADDNVVHGNFGAEPGDPRATVTHVVPSRVKLDGVRKPSGLSAEDAMEALGLGAGIPHQPRSTRVGIKTLQELHQRLDSVLETEAANEQDVLQIATIVERITKRRVLVRGEIDTIARRIAELGGDAGGLRPAGDVMQDVLGDMGHDDDPKGAA